MNQIFIDSISNVRMVVGTIRMDVMNITGQTDDKKLQVEKRSEIVMTSAAFQQMLRTLKEVEEKLKDQFEQAKSKGIFQRLLFVPNFLFQRIVFDWIGLYATNPFRVLFSIVIVNFIFSGIYSLLYSSVNYLTCLESFSGVSEKVFTNLYFSAITFFTVGYGDSSPMGYFKIIAPIEGFIGVFLMSYFTVAFVRKILR